MMQFYTLTVLSVGFQLPSYTVMENTPGFARVVIETRSGPPPGVTGEIGTDITLRVSTADFSSPEAVGEYIVGIVLFDSGSEIIFLYST